VIELVRQVRESDPRVCNLYGRVVRDDGNPVARALVEKYFEPADSGWRGLGTIPASGLALRAEFVHRDASRVPVDVPAPKYVPGCRCGEILKGTIEPPECKLFARACTPDRPLGACMVSSEGTCAAWYRHERLLAGGAA
jgi:hydrogenase expression/formation protein HypD